MENQYMLLEHSQKKNIYIYICCLNLELIYLNLNIASNHVIKLMLDNILTFGSVYFNSIKIDIFVTFVFVFREILTTALRVLV